jgi:hypothetical protein
VLRAAVVSDELDRCRGRAAHARALLFQSQPAPPCLMLGQGSSEAARHVWPPSARMPAIHQPLYHPSDQHHPRRTLSPKPDQAPRTTNPRTLETMRQSDRTTTGSRPTTKGVSSTGPAETNKKRAGNRQSSTTNHRSSTRAPTPQLPVGSPAQRQAGRKIGGPPPSRRAEENKKKST